MPDNSRPPTLNKILNALPDEDLKRLLPDLEKVELTLGQVVYRPEEPITHIYFLENAIISIIAVTAEGQSAEVGVVGFEGIVGIDVLLGADSTLNENLVQHANGAYRIKAEVLKKEFDKCGAVHTEILRFARLLMIQISQTALCNRLHTVEERLSRWLLLCRDRTGTDKLQLTQEFLSIMLGTNRATVTISAIALQSAGYIKYSRGQITIINREGLKDFTCECYGIVKKEYDRF